MTAAIMWMAGQRSAVFWFGAALVVYTLGAFAVTVGISVPMNQALAVTPIPADETAASQIWRDYSETWQAWNNLRTLASGLSVLLAAIGIYKLGQQVRPR